MAYLEKSYTAVCERNIQRENVTGTRVDGIALCFGGRQLWLKNGEDPMAFSSQQGLSVLGLSLPVTVLQKTAVEKCVEEIVLSEEEAKQRCTQTVNALAYGELSSLEILSREYEYDVSPARVVCTAKLRAYADIAAERTEEP
jgi:hypothetical protein